MEITLTLIWFIADKNVYQGVFEILNFHTGLKPSKLHKSDAEIQHFEFSLPNLHLNTYSANYHFSAFNFTIMNL